jgi:hypothetical protein
VPSRRSAPFPAYFYSDQGAAKPYVVETEDWGAAANIPLLVPSRDFIALKLQLEAMAAAARCVVGLQWM